MNSARRGGIVILAMVAVLWATVGCGGKADTAGSNQVASGGPGAGVPGSPIKQIMRSLDKGPNSLNAIGNDLKAPQPAWDVIQKKTADYAKQAAELGMHDPPKGSRDSWAKLTASFASSAEELDKGAQANSLDRARAAQDKLSKSCMECHREHRGGPGGFGPGPGGPGRPGGPPGRPGAPPG
jgi:hypothetical protein